VIRWGGLLVRYHETCKSILSEPRDSLQLVTCCDEGEFIEFASLRMADGSLVPATQRNTNEEMRRLLFERETDEIETGVVAPVPSIDRTTKSYRMCGLPGDGAGWPDCLMRRLLTTIWYRGLASWFWIQQRFREDLAGEVGLDPYV
jgi:hypothetical protein